MHIAVSKSAAEFIRSAGGAAFLYPERRGSGRCPGCSSCEVCTKGTIVAPVARLGVPVADYLDRFQLLEQDGCRIWVHNRLRPSKEDRPMFIDSFRLPLFKPRLVLKHAAYAPAPVAQT